MNVDDMVFSEEEESREVVVTSAEPRDPVATFAGDEQEAAWCAVASTPRKRAASADVIGERAASGHGHCVLWWRCRPHHHLWRT